jgi:hypothetical protein
VSNDGQAERLRLVDEAREVLPTEELIFTEELVERNPLPCVSIDACTATQ